MRYLRKIDNYLRDTGTWPTNAREWRLAIVLTVGFFAALAMPGVIDHVFTWAGI
jgi:hypothetical protein